MRAKFIVVPRTTTLEGKLEDLGAITANALGGWKAKGLFLKINRLILYVTKQFTKRKWVRNNAKSSFPLMRRKITMTNHASVDEATSYN